MNTEILKRLDDAISSTLIGNSKDLDCNVGAAICIIKDGKEVYRNEYGEADKENHIPMERNSIFRCYSMTKPVTAVAVMTLVEKGVIALSDPVSNFIPSFKNQTVLTEKGYVPAKREVVIQDLLNMTAGLTYPDASFPAGKEMQNMIDKYYADVEAGNPISTYDLAVLIGEQPLEFQPGEGWRYSFCADVLGAVIEVVTGKTYGEYLKETIFEPLGMTETDFYVPIEKQNRFMQNYQYMPETQTMEPCTWQHLGLTYMHKKKPLFESGGAGLVSTIDDYSKFVNMMLGKGTLGNVRILGRKTVEIMTRNNLTPKQLEMYDWDTIKGYGYGNLMRVMMDVPASQSFGSEGEFGWDGWLGSYVAMDPKENLAIIYVIQKCGGNGYRDIQVIRDIVYSAL
ncbi:serine hydrolase domain-containing protein [Butyribacter intestini]|uniref:serine hydrolase domain-containing protein n=1 Tax=Butyribacter intestini TaxID=1703332 RepID=UPI003AB5040F